MRVDKQDFFRNNWIDFTNQNIKRYNEGWTFSEIKSGKEFIIQDYDTFFNLQKHDSQ